MKAWIKWPLWSFLILGVLVVAAVLLLPHLVPLESFKPLLQNQVAKATGRPLKIGGDLKLRLFPTAQLSFSDLSLGGAPPFDKTPFVEIAAFDARIKVLSLLRKKLEVTRFVVHKPRITLQRNQKGEVNWGTPQGPKTADTDLAEEKKPLAPPEKDRVAQADPKAPPFDLKISELKITEGHLLWLDDQSGQKREVTDISVLLGEVGIEKPVEVNMAAKVDGQPFRLEGTVGPTALAQKPLNIPFDLALSALEKIRLTTTGKVVQEDADFGFDAQVDLAPFSLPEALASLTLPMPLQTSDPKVLSKIGFKARIQGDSAGLNLSEGKIELDDTHLDLSLTVKTLEQPQINFDLQLDKIDLDRYLPKSDTAGPPDATSNEATEPPVPKPATTAVSAGKASERTAPAPPQAAEFAALHQLKLNGRFKAGFLKAVGLSVSDIDVHLTADQGRLKMEKGAAALYGGTFEGGATLDVQGPSPKLQTHLKAGNIDTGALLTDLGKGRYIEGRASVDLSLKTAGLTADEVKKHLTGKGNLQFLEGALVGIDLYAMAQNVETAFQTDPVAADTTAKTPFGELLIPFSAKNGLITLQKGGLSSPDLTINLAGTADLVSEKLNLRLEPKVLVESEEDPEQKLGVSVPVLVSGEFSDPVFLPDLKSLVEKGLKGELEVEGLKQVIGKENYKPVEKKAKAFFKKLF